MARKHTQVISLCLLLLHSCKPDTATNVTKRMTTYQDEWVIRVQGGPQVASLLALQSGYKNLGLVLGFKDTYLWHKDDHQRQRKRGNLRLVKPLTSHSEILWAEQQKAFERHKRDHILVDLPDSEKPLVREKRLLDEVEPGPRLEITLPKRNWNQGMGTESEIPNVFNDELWNEEWYLQDTRTNKNLPKLDLNVLPLYRLGVTGRGVRVAVLDDGLEYTHNDLRTNYDSAISYDINSGDDDPIPRYEPTGMNAHGTRCAGEIAMEANNHKCGVGVAFEARIGGIKLLDGIVNDRVEGEALGYRQDLVDIYTASWGPSDDGKSLEAPGRLATEALERGIAKGRGGKGNIYVWASGNGGNNGDDCGCDGYVGSVYTIAVGSASQAGKFPWYGERCPATLATTYSSGAYQDQMIATTDLHNNCTTRHTGTSASAPLAAGIFALALEVNKELTWRDVQHLVVYTSEYSPLSDNPGWFKNSAGFWFNSRFGFGLMNAYALVIAAQNWTNVPEARVCHAKPQPILNRTLFYGNTRIVNFDVDGCATVDGKQIYFLEHVQIEISIDYTFRGALQMILTSPSGTRVQVLNRRKLDTSKDGFVKWKFLSVATWGEDPRGTWILEIFDEVGPHGNNGRIDDLRLILRGTEKPPRYLENGPRIYNDEYNRIRKMNHLVPDVHSIEKKTMNDNGEHLSQEVRYLEKIFGIKLLSRFLQS